MSKKTSALTDKQRIKQLEKELLNMRKTFMLRIDQIEKAIGINDDHIKAFLNTI